MIIGKLAVNIHKRWKVYSRLPVLYVEGHMTPRVLCDAVVDVWEVYVSMSVP